MLKTKVLMSVLLGMCLQAEARSIEALLNPKTDSTPFHHVRSARIQVLKEIPLFDHAWTVFAPTQTEVKIVAGFQPTLTDVQCGLLVPPGAATQEAVRTHWDLATLRVSSNGSTFAKLHTQSSNGAELLILCGKGFKEGFFKAMPTIAEVKVLLKDYFEFDFDVIQE